MKKSEERACRTITALPHPDEWNSAERVKFLDAQSTLAADLGMLDRKRGDREASKRARQGSGTWSLSAAREVVYDRSRGICEAGAPGCTGQASHVHHKRGRRGPDPHHPDLLLHVCSECHRWIHANPEQSYARGWLVKRLGSAS